MLNTTLEKFLSKMNVSFICFHFSIFTTQMIYVGIYILSIIFAVCLIYLRFVPYEVNEDDDYTSYENMAVFVISMYQYVTLAIIFSKGRPYRKTIFTNCESSTILKLYPCMEYVQRKKITSQKYL